MMDTNGWTKETANEELRWATEKIEAGRIVHPGLPSAFSQTKEPYRVVKISGDQPIDLIMYLPAIVLYKVPATHFHLYWRKPLEITFEKFSGGGWTTRIWTVYARLLITDKEPLFSDERVLNAKNEDYEAMMSELFAEKESA